MRDYTMSKTCRNQEWAQTVRGSRTLQQPILLAAIGLKNRHEPGERHNCHEWYGFCPSRRRHRAAGAGIYWGDDTLTLNHGRQYNFALKGLDVGSVGISKVNAEAKVYNLNKLSDFDGTYIAGEASVTIGGGSPGVIAMRNRHGVMIELQPVQQGAELTIGA